MEDKVHQLVSMIDEYIEISQDDNFDRYLEQMKGILLEEPHRESEIRVAVQKNMERYQANQKKAQTMPMEFKIGAGVLSGLGVILILTAIVILAQNFLPPVFQGMLMFVCFALVWVIAQMGLVRLWPKVAMGCSAMCIAGLYLSVVMNYHIFESLPLYGAMGIFAGVGIISWLVAKVTDSPLLQCVSFIGCFLFWPMLPVEASVLGGAVLLILVVGLNALWHFGAVKKNRTMVLLMHGISFLVFSWVFGMRLLLKTSGDLSWLYLSYGLLTAIIMNVICLRQKGSGFLALWICGAAYHGLFLLGILASMEMSGTEWLPLLSLLLPVCSVLLLCVKDLPKEGVVLYYQSMGVLMVLAFTDYLLAAIIAGVLLTLAGVWKFKNHRLSYGIVTSVFWYLLLCFFGPGKWTPVIQLAVLLVINLAFRWVPALKMEKGAALVYTNISLMGISILVLPFLDSPIAYVIALILSVAAILILWRKSFYLPERFCNLVLAVVLTYFILGARVPAAVVISILLMLVALAAIIVGFLRRESVLRIFGLCLALFVCVKVLLYDFWGLELLTKGLLLLLVGVIAIGIAVVYGILEARERKRPRPRIMPTETESVRARGENNMAVAQEQTTLAVGVNLFGPKSKLYEDFDGTLERMKQAGITSVELCVAFSGAMEPPKELNLTVSQEELQAMSGGIWPYDQAEQRLAAVRQHGLQVISAHIMLGFSTEPQDLWAAMPKILDFGKRNHISYFVLSLMKDLQGIKRYVPVLNEMCQALDQEGMHLVYHNHEMECIVQEGSSALDHLMEQCPLLKLELDVGWAQFAGGSCLDWIRRYGNRMPLLHLKDIREDAAPETRDTCCTAVGEGSIPLVQILELSKNCPLEMQGIIIDQDASPADILEDLARGAEHIRKAYLG